MTFEDIPKARVEPMFELRRITVADTHPDKVDLGAGVYRNQKGKYHEFETIKSAKKILEQKNLGHDYGFYTGIETFNQAAARLLWGSESSVMLSNRLATVQMVGGTGANRIGAAFLKACYPNRARAGQGVKVYVGTPAWPNYEPIFTHAGFSVHTYTHQVVGQSEVDFKTMLETVDNAEKNSIFILQVCCHNPTGLDLSREQWQRLAVSMLAGEHFAFLDVAYQGFASDTPNAGADDVWPVRYFEDQGIDMLACQSFSKNMGLYGERVGALHVPCRTTEIATNVRDQLRLLIRREISSAPAYGARLVDIILNDDDLHAQWTIELSQASARVMKNREELHRLLTQTFQTPGSWDNIIKEKGLFSMLKLRKPEIDRLIAEFHIYLPPSGRINVAGLNENNIMKVSLAIDTVVRERKN